MGGGFKVSDSEDQICYRDFSDISVVPRGITLTISVSIETVSPVEPEIETVSFPYYNGNNRDNTIERKNYVQGSIP